MLDVRANSIEYAAQLAIIDQLDALITSKKLGRKKRESWKKLFTAGRYLDIVGNKAILDEEPLSKLTYIYECLISLLGLNKLPANPGNVSISTSTIQIGIPGPRGPQGVSSYLYFGFADDTSGTGFTTTYNPSKDFLAFVQSDTPILSVDASTFSGKWFQLSGTDGADGQDGVDGADGIDGVDGANGTAVLSGSSNPGAGVGNNGDFFINIISWTIFGPKTGGTWPSGTSMIGADGADGADGTSILTGNGAPDDILGNDGDVYLDIATYDLYAPKTAGVWPSGVSLIGTQGEPGTPGADGQPGITGENGISAYVYIGYADDILGTGYILVESNDDTAILSAFNANKEYIGIIISSSQIGGTITDADFLNSWTKYRGDGDRWATSSATTLTIGTGNQLLIVDKGLSYTTGQLVVIAVSGDPTSLMQGLVVNYNPVSGQLSVAVDVVDGAGTYSVWDVNLQAGVISPPSNIYGGATPTNITVGGLAAGTDLTGMTYDGIIEAMTQFYYVPAFSAFAISGQSTSIEVGTTISGSKTFTWTTTNSANVGVNTIVIKNITGGSSDLATGLANDGTEAGIAVGTITKTTATSHVWRIVGTNTNSATFQRDFTVNWLWMRYSGTSTNTTLIESEIEALTTTALSSGITGTYSFAAGGYKYLVWDDVLGSPTASTGFKDSSTNLAVDMADSSDHADYSNTQNGWSYALVSVTNAQGVVSDKRVYRTRNILGASINIIVS